MSAAVLIAVLAAALAFVLWPGGVERFCGRPENLRTVRNVTLVADAMDAFRRAENSLGVEIDVVESYRSCRRQAAVCEAICGTRRGCPGLCAPPGLSWHQRALAIDVTQEMLDTPGVIDALEAAGWCQSLPASDPGHFSYDGCH
jgi:LAS superfamily LD-carboxypeptidase LdcB